MTLTLAVDPTNLNPDTPTSILAAVVALGTLIVLGLLVAIRVLWRKVEEQQTTIDKHQTDALAVQAANVNRERQLGQEMFPVLKQVGTVLEAVQHGMAITVQQARSTPPPTPAVSNEIVERLTSLLSSLENRGEE